MIEIWHNPRCSKSRQALALLQQAGAEIIVRLYLQDPPDEAELTAAWEALGKPAIIDMMRPGEKRFAELGLNASASDATLRAAMVRNPILIERPLAIAVKRAVIGRPPERVSALL